MDICLNSVKIRINGTLYTGIISLTYSQHTQNLPNNPQIYLIKSYFNKIPTGKNHNKL